MLSIRTHRDLFERKPETHSTTPVYTLVPLVFLSLFLAFLCGTGSNTLEKAMNINEYRASSVERVHTSMRSVIGLKFVVYVIVGVENHADYKEVINHQIIHYLSAKIVSSDFKRYTA